MSAKSKSKKLTRRQPTARSQSIVTHVDAISGYNDRLSQILDVEKNKDAQMRKMEEILFADKLRHAELIADVSFGHDLMELEKSFDNEYSSLESRHETMDAELREVIQAHEESVARVSVAEVDTLMLQSQLEQARAREEALKSMMENYTTKNDTLRANEKAAASRATALAKKSDEARSSHSSEFDARPANQEMRKNGKEIVSLVKKAQKLRNEHAKIMHDLHAIETKEIKIFETEASNKLKEQEEKLRNQFTKDELKRIGKHDTYQHDLKLEMDRLEDKIKGDMEVKEKNLRNKIKKSQMDRMRLTTSIEEKRQQVVDFLAERNVHMTQMKHVDAMIGERTKTYEKLARELKDLQSELETTRAQSKNSVEARKKVHHKYSSVIKQNEKMAAEINKFSSLVHKGEEELEFSPPTKRIRQDKLA